MLKITATMVLGMMAASACMASAQTENPFVRSADQEKLRKEALSFLDAGKPVVSEAAKSTVGIYFGPHRIAYGLVVRDNMIVTKWSEVNGYRGTLKGLPQDGRWRSLEVIGGLEEHDIAVLSYTGGKLPPVQLKADAELEAGDFLVVPRSDGEVASTGVLSVLPRSLRNRDKGYLGVVLSPEDRQNVIISDVEAGSAADEAGVKAGDKVTHIGDESIESFAELSNILKRSGAGQEVVLKVERGGQALTLKATLKGTDRVRVHGLAGRDQRAQRMQRMGLRRLSKVRADFPNIIQTDLDVEAEDCGAPVVNLRGEVIGMVISRASRIKTYVLPASVIEDLLAMADKEN